MNAIRTTLCVVLLFVCTASLAWSAEAGKNSKPQEQPPAPTGAVAPTVSTATPPPAVADKTQPKPPATKVAVELEGTDILGSRLSLQLKELFNSGTLFSLSDKEEPKIRLLLSTAPEFPSRPSVGSTYCAVWVYYERSTAFESYLARETGVITGDGVSDLAARLAERTSGIAVKYAYLLKQ